MWPEIFQTVSLQTSNPRVNFSASQTVQRSRQRMQPRRKEIKKGPKGENWFQVHSSGVAWDGEIAFLYTATVASETGDGLGFKSRSLSFGVRWRCLLRSYFYGTFCQVCPWDILIWKLRYWSGFRMLDSVVGRPSLWTMWLLWIDFVDLIHL